MQVEEEDVVGKQIWYQMWLLDETGWHNSDWTRALPEMPVDCLLVMELKDVEQDYSTYTAESHSVKFRTDNREALELMLDKYPLPKDFGKRGIEMSAITDDPVSKT